jgi:hypothetical protein
MSFFIPSVTENLAKPKLQIANNKQCVTLILHIFETETYITLKYLDSANCLRPELVKNYSKFSSQCMMTCAG